MDNGLKLYKIKYHTLVSSVHYALSNPGIFYCEAAGILEAQKQFEKGHAGCHIDDIIEELCSNRRHSNG